MLHLLLVLRKQFPMIVVRGELWDLLGFLYWNYVLLWIHVHLRSVSRMHICPVWSERPIWSTYTLTLSKSKSLQTTSIDVAEVGVILVGGREILEMWKEASMSLTAALSPDCMRSLTLRSPKIHIPLLLLGISSSASASSTRAFLAVPLVVGKLLVRTVSYSCL